MFLLILLIGILTEMPFWFWIIFGIVTALKFLFFCDRLRWENRIEAYIKKIREE